MRKQTLVTPEELAEHLNDPQWAIVDCRFSLDDKERGRQEYLRGHIPGAVYAHLEQHLSGPVIPRQSGRHPLPNVEAAAVVFSNLGIERGVQVVAYDDKDGSYAARVWWMLRWLGHTRSAVLDGGWQAWQAGGFPVHSGEEKREPRHFFPRVRAAMLADAGDVENIRLDPAWRLVDARLPERYRGETEPIDPVAGHIPGAVNFPYVQTVDASGRLLRKQELRERFRRLLAGVPPERTIFYCGSGVTAAQAVLAFVHSGLGEPRLYPGSWSEWIASGDRPVATGEEKER